MKYQLKGKYIREDGFKLLKSRSPVEDLFACLFISKVHCRTEHSHWAFKKKETKFFFQNYLRLFLFALKIDPSNEKFEKITPSYSVLCKKDFVKFCTI